MAAAARIARNRDLLQEGQGLELVSMPGFASCFMLIGKTDHVTKHTIASDKDAWEVKTFVSAEILNTGYFTQIIDVVPTAVDSNISVARGQMCVQTCQVDTHQLPADIDMHILAYTHKCESARRAAIDGKTKQKKAQCFVRFSR